MEIDNETFNKKLVRMKLAISIILLVTCIGSAFGQRRNKKSLTNFPLTVECIDAYDMQPEEGVLLYLDSDLIATSDSLGLINVGITRKSSSVTLSLIHKDSSRTTVVMKEYLSDLVNKYQVLLHPNSEYEDEIWKSEDSLYGSVNKERIWSDSIAFPLMSYSDSTAHLIGGKSALYDYINSNLKTELLPNTSTLVYMRFIVEKDGNLSHIIAYNEVDIKVKCEAIRLCRNMPKWSPGSINGKPIRTMAQLPITITFK